MITTRYAARPLLRWLPIAIAAALMAFWSAPSRADIPPSCDMESALVTCAATDVGQPCQSGGTCFEIMCSSGVGVGMKLYKCDACPTIVAAPSGTCTISNMGTACGDSQGATGTCGAIRSWCNTSADKYVCQVPPTTTTGGAGAGGASGGGSAGEGGADASSGGAGGGGAADGSAGSAGSGSGGSAGSAGSTPLGTTSSGSGCDIVPTKPPKPTAIGLGLIAIALLVFFFERGRRRR